MKQRQNLWRVTRSNRSRAGSRFVTLRSPGPCVGAKKTNQRRKTLARNGLKRWQEAPGLGEPSMSVKRQFHVNEPSSLERGSAATRTVVRSISSAARWNELTHISRINRR
jgi:hypothetical protein